MALTEASGTTLPPGERLGNYTIEACLGTGQLASVYRAHDAETGVTVALKRLLEATQTTGLETEARLLSHLRHPRVAVMVDHFRDADGGYTLVTGVRRGLRSRTCALGPGGAGPPGARGAQGAHEACEVLEYVHSQQIVHADVKPANIVCGRDGSVLVDFGLSQALRPSERARRLERGTARFMAPEVFAGDPPSPRSDVYSLAATYLVQPARRFATRLWRRHAAQ